MGTTSAGLFADDTAKDVRDEWTQSFRWNASAKKATAEVRASMKDEFRDSDDGPVALLALAVTLWKHGCLDAKTKAQALRIIDRRLGLGRWREAGQTALRERLKVYVHVRALLRTKQPKSREVTFKPKKVIDTGLRIGEVFSIPLPKGDTGRGYFQVIALKKSQSTIDPVVRLLNVQPDADPARLQWSRIKPTLIRHLSRPDDPNQRCAALELYWWQKRDWDRSLLTRLDISIQRPSRQQLARIMKDTSFFPWARLSTIVRPSLDNSIWMTPQAVYEWCIEHSARDISQLQKRLEIIRNRVPHFQLYTLTVAYKLLRVDGDYSRAEALLRLHSTITGDAPLQMYGHALLGLGREDEANQLWQQLIKKAKGKFAINILARHIDNARLEVRKRLEGTPLPVPPII